ncbi:MAG: S46 family peptidase [Bacteroidales bacterium]|nr:S46 family peptidase [Bacteroidales bacterium]
MKKSLLILISLLVVIGIKAQTPPDEGMWLPMFVKNYNYADMQRLGLKLTAEQMYDINNSSLKDAIVQLGNFCTGEIISDQGLMLTNHHCGYSSIADHSSEEHDYLKYGFWAKNRDEELPNEGLTVTFLVKMADVTSDVLAGITDSTKKSERSKKIKAATDKLKKENSDDGRYTVVIKPFYEGNEYYMFVYEIFKDVRLVGAPPSSIGKFGDETDNWVWPRHTGDFSIFRIYTAPDGSPATYSPDNVPLKPKHVLPLNISGVQEGDYAMIWGYPGTTNRFMTSYEIENYLKVDNTATIKAFDMILPVIREEMNARDAVRIAYASSYASMANYWKNSKGKGASLVKLKIADQKAAEEARLLEWINADPARVEKYGDPMKAIAKTCANNDADAMSAFWYCNFSLSLSKILILPYQVNFEPKDDKATFSDEQKATLLEQYRGAMEGADAVTEAKIIAATLNLFKTLPEKFQPDIYEYINKKFKGDFDAYAKFVVEKSIIGNEENFKKFLDKPSAKVYQNDAGIKYYSGIFKVIMLAQGNYREFNSKLSGPRRKYIAALKEMNADKPMYPDANSTMRCTYGTVMDYYPSDGVHYKYYTTAQGILEKEVPGDPEFDVDPKLKQLILDKDFGRYADKNGYLPVCFLTNNDITGGNSGSPVLNAKGELIGCAFDGNIEALSSDIAYDPKLQRCINVDIRYVLFVIDKFAGATHLIKEMNIVGK